MSKLLSKMQWDLVEYNLEKEKWQQTSHQNNIPSSTVSVSVPLGALRKKKLNKEPREGYITERKAGEYIERKIRKYQNGGSRIIKLPHEHLWDGEEVLKPYYRIADCWVDKESGEFMHPDKPLFMRSNSCRMSNPRQVWKTCNNFKWLVRANQKNIRLFVTLTYRENMTDTSRLYDDFRKFWQRLQYAYNHKKEILTGYLVAFEPQKRGAWHAHLLLLSPDPLLRIPNKRMCVIWGLGFTKTQRVKHINDVGAYITSYLTNLKDGKKTKKGQRLSMYPAGFRFLRSSRNVERVKIDKWYGDVSRVSFNPCEYSLLYDYVNYKSISQNMVQCTKVLCLKKISPS